MASIQYKGINKKGEKVEGRVNANNQAEARSQLREKGIRPIFISKPEFEFKISSGVSGDVLVLFTRQLQVLINAGVPLVQGLEMLEGQIKTISPAMAKIVNSLKNSVSEGKYLWEAIANYPDVFPKLYSALIRAGESSGQLEPTLKRLTKYIEDSEKLKKILKSAMIYPIGVIAVAIGVITLLLVMVIPKFEEMLTGAGEELPGPTKFVIDASHFIVNHKFSLPLIVGGTIFALVRYCKSETGRRRNQVWFFKAPVFGAILQKGAVARFSRTMYALLSSGINLLDATTICQETVDNAVVEEDIKKIRLEIERGKTLGEVVSKLKSLPALAVQMIAVGESTGSLDKMLDKVADFYELEVETLVAGLTKLIEPVLLVVLGGLVGGMLIAMYLPIFKLASSMK
jgi:type IV pilus assembly protein PilC